MNLSEQFLAPYRKKGDLFPSLLSRSVYLSKYCRNGETWTDTIRRVVEANCAADPSTTTIEAELLFDAMWKMKVLPPGRGLFTGGVPGIPVQSRINCWHYTLRSTADFEWQANRLLEGGGVGVTLNEHRSLPAVQTNPRASLTILCSKSHPNEMEVSPNEVIPEDADMHLAEDSRQGWARALRITIDHALEGRSLCVNVSPIRPRGDVIKTFGGIAPGPAPLVAMLRAVWAVVRARAGGKLGSVDCLDIVNHIGECIKSGGVRRSAIIQYGDLNDRAFRSAKRDFDANPHRGSSNNSIVFRAENQFETFDWEEFVQDNEERGDPGFLNLWLVQRTDKTATGGNPCNEATLGDYDSCNLSNIFPSRFDAGDDRRELFKLITRYTVRQRLAEFEDPAAEKIRKSLMRIGVGLGGLCDFRWSPNELTEFYAWVRTEANSYADTLGVARPHTVTVVKPDGSVGTMSGTSNGVHAAYAPYYIRRIRIMTREPMFHALVEAKVPFEPCKYDPAHTAVFEIPMKANATAYGLTEPVSDQIERVLRVQESYTDQMVSSTINYNDENKTDLVNLLKQNGKRLKGLSLLKKGHKYVQAPFEEIDAGEYAKRIAPINVDHPLTYSDDAFTIECEGGACPIR